MNDLLTGYEVNPPTWFYLSLLLIIAAFFRFGRVWSLRNLDLVLLLSITPGLLMINPDRVGVRVDELPERYFFLRTLGASWLFAGTGLVLLRVLCDPLFRRRPPIDPNLNAHGLVFLGLAAFSLLMLKVLVEPPSSAAVEAVVQGEKLTRLQDTASEQAGPTTTAAGAAAGVLARTVTPDSGETSSGVDRSLIIAARIMPALSHLAVVIGLVLIGRNHFGDFRQGVAMATLYLLVPCTAYDVGKVNHVLPAALCIWAFVAVRRPVIAGGLMGIACGALTLLPVILFLLPLWCVFYERKRAVWFALSLVVVGGALLVGVLALTSPDVPEFTQRLREAAGGVVVEFLGKQLEDTTGPAAGFWNAGNLAYRIPVIVVFVSLMVGLTVWPRRKTLEHLIAHSAALVVATQFWYSHQGGVYVLWYLPLLLLVVFRPRLVSVAPPGSSAAFPDTWQEPVGSHVPVGTGGDGSGR